MNTREQAAVAAPQIGASMPTLTAAVAPDGRTLTVTVADGPAQPTDWVGLFVPGTDDHAVDAFSARWSYLNGLHTPPAAGLARATLSFLPGTGTYEARLFQAVGRLRLAASAPVAMLASAPDLTLTARKGLVLVINGQTVVT